MMLGCGKLALVGGKPSGYWTDVYQNLAFYFEGAYPAVIQSVKCPCCGLEDIESTIDCCPLCTPHEKGRKKPGFVCPLIKPRQKAAAKQQKAALDQSKRDADEKAAAQLAAELARLKVAIWPDQQKEKPDESWRWLAWARWALKNNKAKRAIIVQFIEALFPEVLKVQDIELQEALGILRTRGVEFNGTHLFADVTIPAKFVPPELMVPNSAPSS